MIKVVGLLAIIGFSVICFFLWKPSENVLAVTIVDQTSAEQTILARADIANLEYLNRKRMYICAGNHGGNYYQVTVTREKDFEIMVIRRRGKSPAQVYTLFTRLQSLERADDDGLMAASTGGENPFTVMVLSLPPEEVQKDSRTNSLLCTQR